MIAGFLMLASVHGSLSFATLLSADSLESALERAEASAAELGHGIVGLDNAAYTQYALNIIAHGLADTVRKEPRGF